MTRRKPTVLFVCMHNAGRSQLAAGLATARGGDQLRVTSAGLDPEDHVSEEVIASLAEHGIDWSGRTPTKLTAQAVADADVVIALKPGLDLPVVEGVRYETWPLPDPAGWDVDGIRPLREHLERRIAALLTDLNTITEEHL
ncbi:Glutaredoxin arsenate reductase [Cellulomonas sp. T2.31MG-18]|jgi:protein-tyrosine-phosphatase|uniref:arsenate-mycothiol transferase ArsC n=1 Tax=Cellulomonas sp. T2.31MG-18 TaxID=3157619 RepID=UPI0035EC4DAE